MRLSREEVEHIAELARLGLTEEDKERFAQQLSAILEYAETLQKLDTAAIPPTAQVLALQNVMRTDEVTVHFVREDVLANAPETENGYFKIQAVLDHE